MPQRNKKREIYSQPDELFDFVAEETFRVHVVRICDDQYIGYTGYRNRHITYRVVNKK